VAIDATALGSGRGGDETLLRAMLVGLAAATPDGGPDSFVLYRRPGAPLPEAVVGRASFAVRDLPWSRPWRSRPVRYGITLPRQLLGERAPPHLVYTQTHAPPVSPVPVVLQLTDLSFRHHPELYPPLTRLRLNLLVPLHARRARAVLAISEFTRRDLLRAYRLPPERVFVVPCAVEPKPASEPESPARQAAWLAGHGIGGPFFLFVGNLHPRKNLRRLVEAFERARRAGPALAGHQLVLVGTGHDFYPRLWGPAEAQTMLRETAGAVVLTGWLPDAARDRLLGAAVALVYPSIYEGFGLPPLEAMAAGTPVLASDAAAIPEVLGDAALLVDPYDTEAMAGALIRLATDDALRRTLSERGRRQAAAYAPRPTGERALEAFHWAAEEGRSPGSWSGDGSEGAAGSRWGAGDHSFSTPGSSATRSSFRHQAATARLSRSLARLSRLATITLSVTKRTSNRRRSVAAGLSRSK
jgi:glycosyltransferase involved in cell wall biosynthesis